MFNSSNNSTIKFIGCCHIGKKEYFSKLQKECEDGIVLYEGVGRHYLNNGKEEYDIQSKIAEKTGFIFQSDGIIYYPNWINSDMMLSEILPIKNVLSVLKGDNHELEDLNSNFLIFIMSKILPLLKIFISREPITLLRNRKVTTDIVRYVSLGTPKINVLYGEAHLNDFIKTFKKLGWKVSNKKKLKVFK